MGTYHRNNATRAKGAYEAGKTYTEGGDAQVACRRTLFIDSNMKQKAKHD